jgi:hypothetical protein
MRRSLLLGMLLLACLPTTARGELLADSKAEGKTPLPALHNAVLDPAAPVRLVVNASPGRALAVTLRLDCYRDLAHRAREYKLPRRAPIDRRIRFPVRNPDYCFLDAEASFDDAIDQDGWIVVKLYGRAALTAPLDDAPARETGSRRPRDIEGRL